MQHALDPAAASSLDGDVKWRAYLPAAILIISLFFMWGVANNLNDVLIAHFKKAFLLSDLQSGLVQSAFYMGYFTLAIPASIFMRRFSYKAAIVVGLTLYGGGALMFYPAAEARTYELFLLSLFVIASGLAFLETAANPLVTVLGPSETSERRLNLAQSFNSLGAISGVLIGREFILTGQEPTAAELASLSAVQRDAFFISEAQAVQTPYLVLGGIVLIWALVAAMTRFPRTTTPDQGAATTDQNEFRALLSRRRYLFGVAAQFFYVGAQVGIWSFMIRYAQVNVQGTTEKDAAAVLTVSLILFLLGRFVGTALMGRIAPTRMMALYALINVLLCGGAIAVPGPIGLYCLVLTSFFMSIMFPTIFAASLKDLGPLTKSGSSLLIMAIIGGAILPAVMGVVSDISSISNAMVVPLFCFAIVAAFASAGQRK